MARLMKPAAPPQAAPAATPAVAAPVASAAPEVRAVEGGR
jgi:hypothetical protein